MAGKAFRRRRLAVWWGDRVDRRASANCAGSFFRKRCVAAADVTSDWGWAVLSDRGRVARPAAALPAPQPSAGTEVTVKSQSRTVRTAPHKARWAAHAAKTRPFRPAGVTAKAKSTGAAASGPGGGPRRKFVVFVSLVGLLTLTSCLLLALAPAPLTPGTVASLFAIDARSMDAVFHTSVPVTKQRWRSIYIHHSGTPSGNAESLGRRVDGLADHFVIGNGVGCVDGEVQIGHRWSSQLPAGTVPGTSSVAPDCISICVVGDFDRAVPTPTQRMRLTQLVQSLQGRLGLSDEQVYLHQGTGTAADIGSRFPVASFREQLLP